MDRREWLQERAAMGRHLFTNTGRFLYREPGIMKEASVLDTTAVRSHFPALDPASHGGTAPVYFDNPAGTQIASEALAGITSYLVQTNANHDGAYRASRESDAMVADTRAALADFLGARRPEEICFGQNMTSLTLHISRSIAQELSPGDEVVVTRLDHDANISPWLLAARDRDCVVRWVDFDPADCTWSAEALARQVSSRTKLVAVGYASNSTGTVNPVAEAARIAREAGALCFVDAVHYAPHGPIDVSAVGCDLLACSAYKFFGPHTGILWGRYDLLDRLAAYKVRPASDVPPHKWETGTQGFEGIAGVRGALLYLEWVGRTYGAGARATRRETLRAAMAAIREYEAGLCAALRDGLSSVPGLCIRGVTDASRMGSRVPTFSFTLQGHHPRAICQALDAAGISAWDGNYYAPEVTRRLGLEESGGMVRVGAVHYTTHDEVRRLVDTLGAIATQDPRSAAAAGSAEDGVRTP
jgi:cysteine desulfurase family protein (TIGR01976 family)